MRSTVASSFLDVLTDSTGVAQPSRFTHRHRTPLAFDSMADQSAVLRRVQSVAEAWPCSSAQLARCADRCSAGDHGWLVDVGADIASPPPSVRWRPWRRCRPDSSSSSRRASRRSERCLTQGRCHGREALHLVAILPTCSSSPASVGSRFVGVQVRCWGRPADIRDEGVQAGVRRRAGDGAASFGSVISTYVAKEADAASDGLDALGLSASRRSRARNCAICTRSRRARPGRLDVYRASEIG